MMALGAPGMLGALLMLPALLLGCGTGEARQGLGDGAIVLLDRSERQPAPQLSGRTLSGDSFDLADHTGQVVVLNVWASWCGPCRAEAPALREVWRRTRPQVQFVGLVTKDSASAARAFADRHQLGYPHLLDGDGALQLRFRDTLPPQAIPSTVVIDADGQVAARALGEISAASLRGMVEPLLVEAGLRPEDPSPGGPTGDESTSAAGDAQ